MRQNYIYTFLIYLILLLYVHFDYVLFGFHPLGGPLYVALIFCHSILDAAIATLLSDIIHRRWWHLTIATVIGFFGMANVFYLRQFSTYVDITLIGEMRNLDIIVPNLISLFCFRDMILIVLYISFFLRLTWRQSPQLILKIHSYCIHSAVLLLAVVFISLLSLYGLFMKGTKCIVGEVAQRIHNTMEYSSFDAGSEFGLTHLMLYEIISNNISRKLTATDRKTVADYKKIHSTDNFTKQRMPKTIILFIMESILSDAVTKVCQGDTVMPYLYKLAENAKYCNLNMQSESKLGWSSDGQFTIMTGLLPHSRKITVSNFAHNNYTALGHLLSKKGMQTAMLIPTGKHIWRQEDMCRAYGIHDLLSTTNLGSDNDQVLFNNAISIIDSLGHQPVFLTIINMSTHSPYDYHFDSRRCEFHDNALSKQQLNYYERANYYDYHLGRFIKYIHENGLWNDAMIILTADHHLEEPWCYHHYHRPAIPLIITGGYQNNLLHKPIQDKRTVYQSDIYPTILQLLGIRSEWRGVGVSLYYSMIRQSEAKRQQLSDILLETNTIIK